LLNGNAARLRARRMRLEMTMSDSGPVPRSHSPLVWVKLSRFIPGLPVPQQVPQAGFLFETFLVHPAAQLPAQFHFALHGPSRRSPRRDLAHVLLGAVDAKQQWLQALAKDRVVVRAAKPSLGPKLHILYTAHRAGQPRKLVRELADVMADQRLQYRRQVQF